MKFYTDGNISVGGKEYVRQVNGSVDVPDGVDVADMLAHGARLAPADEADMVIKKRSRKPRGGTDEA